MKSASEQIRHMMESIQYLNEHDGKMTVGIPGKPFEFQEVNVEWTSSGMDDIVPLVYNATTGEQIPYISLGIKDQQKIHDHIMRLIHANDKTRHDYKPEEPKAEESLGEADVNDPKEAIKKKHFKLQLTISNPEPFPDNGTEEEQLAFPDEIEIGVNWQTRGKYIPATMTQPEEHPETDGIEIYNLTTGKEIDWAVLDQYAKDYIDREIVEYDESEKESNDPRSERRGYDD